MTDTSHSPLGTEPADAQVAAHTPGPWRFHRTSLGFAAVVTGIKEVITKVICVYGDDGAPEAHSALSDADAHLIAAAPELRDFAAGVTDDLGFAEWATPEHAEEILRDLIEKWHTKGRAAIAIARGVSQ